MSNKILQVTRGVDLQFGNHEYIDKYGYMDRNADWTISPKFDEAWEFYYDRAVVGMKKNGKIIYTIIDNSGRILSSLHGTKFEQCTSMIKNTASELIYSIVVDEEYRSGTFVAPRQSYHIDVDGNKLYKNKYTWCSNIDEYNTFSAAITKNTNTFRSTEDKWGIADINGVFIIEPLFEGAGRLTRDLFCVVENEKASIIDLKYNKIAESISDDIGYVGEGLLAVYDGKIGSYNRYEGATGRLIEIAALGL